MNNMKSIITLGIAVILYGYSVTVSAQANSGVTLIELSKTARGYQEEIRIAGDSLHVWIENSVAEKPPVKYSRPLESEQWTKLVNSFKAVKLVEIPVLPAPSMKRASDAAKHSTLTITTQDGKTYAHGFDDENPHVALLPLLKAIRELESMR
jgi:hypothetical protein